MRKIESKFYKRIVMGVFAGINILSLAACGSDTITASAMQDAKPVTYIETAIEDYSIYMNYNGFVAADEVRNLPFEVSGTIKSVHVEKGQQIKDGDILAELDTTTMQMGINSSKQDILLAQNAIAQIQDSITSINSGIEAEKLNLETIRIGIEAEELSLKKIQDSYKSSIDTIMISYNQIKDTYDRTAALYASGAISQKDFEDAGYAFETIEKQLRTAEQSRDNDIALQMKNIENMKNNMALQKINISAMEDKRNAANTQIQAANLTVNQANIALELNQKQLGDAVLKSNMDGYVVEVTARPGAVVGAGTPIVVIKSGESVVNIGISVSDFNRIKSGMPVTLTHNSETFSGRVDTVSLYPDESTGTYNVKIIPEKDDLAMGTLLDVAIPVENKAGVFIPMQAVINISGVNYVYCAESDGANYIAVRREVILGDVRGEKVLAKNLAPGQLVITEGVRNLRDNDIVIID